MKRNLLIIFLFFILFSALKVNALERRFASSEYLDDIFYYKYDGKIYHFKYGKVIRDIESNEVAYCIQPFDDLVDNTAYKESISYNESFGISEENEWTTSVSLDAKDGDGGSVGHATISGAPFKRNRATEYSGSLFASGGVLDVGVNGEWENSVVGTW